MVESIHFGVKITGLHILPLSQSHVLCCCTADGQVRFYPTMQTVRSGSPKNAFRLPNTSGNVSCAWMDSLAGLLIASDTSVCLYDPCSETIIQVENSYSVLVPYFSRAILAMESFLHYM